MHRLQAEIQEFTSFAIEHLSTGDVNSLDELYDRWREVHPAAEDALAVKASLRDMDNGETGRPFNEFASEFSKRNNITDDQ